jgi:heme exporter protein B
LFFGKCLGNFIFVAILECLMVPLFIVFYNVSSAGPAWQLGLVLLLGTWALVVNGTFFAAMSIRTRNRELMLPLLLLPVSIPAVVTMVQATANVITAEFSAVPQIKFLAVYCVVFTSACFLLFDLVLNAE